MNRSSFYGLEIAKTGLFYNQRALDVVGHNISNADTPGYTRQRLTGQAVVAGGTLGRLSYFDKAIVGGGVSMQRLTQIRDEYLDIQYRIENAAMGNWRVRTGELQYIESMFDEMADTGFSKQLANFFDSLQELSQDPVNLEYRTNVQQNAVKLTETFNHYFRRLSDTQVKEDDALDASVLRINEISANIVKLNDIIQQYEMSGSLALDLRDQRNLLLDELSQYVQIEVDYKEQALGMTKTEYMTVNMRDANGKLVELINHKKYNELEAKPDTAVPPTSTLLNGDAARVIRFATVNTPNAIAAGITAGTAFNPSSGEMRARIDLRDGNTKDNVGIPYLVEQLNILARTIAEQINLVHAGGWTQAYTDPVTGIYHPSETGVLFFNVEDTDGDGVADYDSITAGNFKLDAKILESAFNIAASSKRTGPESGDDEQRGNNEIALRLAELINDKTLPGGGFEDFLKSTIVNLAIEVGHSKQMASAQDTIMLDLESQRQAISGVSLDEEMADMVKFQHGYNAAARLITAMDEMFDTIINRLGVVGR